MPGKKRRSPGELAREAKRMDASLVGAARRRGPAADENPEPAAAVAADNTGALIGRSLTALCPPSHGLSFALQVEMRLGVARTEPRRRAQ